MNCPRCSQEEIPATPQCPGCGFTLRALDAHFGIEPVVLERLIDAAHCLKLRQKEIVEDRLLDFERRFPQLFASVYIGVLPEWTTVSEFGFWLLNRSTITGSEIARDNRHTFLLVLDPDSRTASVTAGYTAEKILRPKEFVRAIERPRSHWRSGEFADGVVRFLRQLSKSLRRATRRIPGAHRAPADQLDTLPPPDLTPRPVRAPGSSRSDILEINSPPQSVRETRNSVARPTAPVMGHQLDLAAGVSFSNHPTAIVS